GFCYTLNKLRNRGILMKIPLTHGNWENKLFHGYTVRFPYTPKLIQEQDCIRNGRNPQMRDGFDYTSLLTKETYSYKTEIATTCSFEKFGAPMLLLVDDVKEDEAGNLWYGGCYEVVLFEEGINVWKHYMVGDKVKWVKLFFAAFPVDVNTKYELRTTILETGFEIALNDKKYFLRIDDLPAQMHVGFTAGEDINRFYDFSIHLPTDNSGKE
ncbi:MAG: hypothetical protein Q4B26_14175, partial [Eubacteriales bacterium]|nr:hypothetical protein [Eubacteriales bacterium]